MSLLTMQKIRLISYQESAPKMAELLQKKGVVELTDITAEQQLQPREKRVFSFDHAASRVELAVEFLSQYADRSLLKTVFEQDRVATTEEKIEETVHTFFYADLVQNTLTLTENINNTNAKLQELDNEEKLLSEWREWDTPLSQPLTTRYTNTWLLKGDSAELDALVDELEDHPHTTFQRCGEKTLALTYLHSDQEALKKLVVNHKLDTVTLPSRRGTPDKELTRIERAKAKARDNLKQYHHQARELTQYLPKLKMISDYLHWKKERYDVIHQTLGTEECVVLEGWIPRAHLPRLEKELHSNSKLCTMETVPDEEINEEPPSEIKNSSMIAPFESVTRLYGLPAAGNLDPSPYLAGFFFVFFGFCLSDVGYGLILSGLTAAILYFYKVDRSMASFLNLLMAGGIASMLAGLLFGGYFGIDAQHLPPGLLYFQQFDPIGDPLPIFYVALAMGVIQIIFGMLLSILRASRNNELTKGLLDNLPWLAFFAALGWWAAESFEILPATDGLANYAIIITLLVIVISRAWQAEGNIFLKIPKGVLGLYDFVGYLSDTLSYSRLLALGLATSALAFSVNLIAEVVNDTVPYIGWLLMIIVLIIGHLFNMVVNILSSFIHTARLQFVEFFGKFITDTGRNFRPFERTQKHTYIEESDPGSA